MCYEYIARFDIIVGIWRIKTVHVLQSCTELSEYLKNSECRIKLLLC